MSRPFFEIPYYHDYLSPSLAKHLLEGAMAVEGVEGLVQVGGQNQGLESQKGLQFLAELYSEVKGELGKVLKQRQVDRVFMDERVKACSQFNSDQGREIDDKDYETILGMEDSRGRIVIGPKRKGYHQEGSEPIAEIPEFLRGPHVTLFGPPGSAKMAINAMNAYHRKIVGEPAIVEELLSQHSSIPKWGADDEDSKTPLRRDLVDAGVNLSGCFDRSINDHQDVRGNSKYQLANDHLAIPIKRFPGLALPSSFLFFRDNPIPLHLYDFALHLFHNWQNPQALVFYVPKLENEEEAAYIHNMIEAAERKIKELHSEYVLGSVRLMVVLENPRAILRTHEIIDALYPYFVGASLGWHDYLGSTARLFKEDSHYRIPVKADPDIVIKYIKASHNLLAKVVGSRGGIKVGGMYGILPLDNDLKSKSFQMTMLGFIKDVVTQMKRDLTGYWVAHPDFVRLGIALVEAWKLHAKGDSRPLETMVKELLVVDHHDAVLSFIHGEDIEGLDEDDPGYVRSLLVADIRESDFIANNDPEEVRYNIFQSLQYITDWLSGNGCVALPAIVNGVAVRVMDDLATAERSRWEVWHELYHGRFTKEDLVRIAHEEMHFIRKDLSNEKKIVQVKWNEASAKWYPVAMELMLQLMTDPNPPEFATELLMPFTVDEVRDATDPWEKVRELDPGKYQLPEEIQRLHGYFEACGCTRFAMEMSKNAVYDPRAAEACVLSFSKEEVIEAASFHGNIGEAKKTLDKQAASEQKLVFDESEEIRQKLQTLGEEYLKKFGVKFLISAKGKTGKEMLAVLEQRLSNSEAEELDNARKALWEITAKRLNSASNTKKKIEKLLKKHEIAGAGIAINSYGATQSLGFGEAQKGKISVEAETRFEIASLSKTFAAAFALEYFKSKKVPICTSVDSLFEKTDSDFRIGDERVQIQHLLNHTALNMHYVNGVELDQPMPSVGKLLTSGKDYGYERVRVISEPGKVFSYSGAGFLVLEHLLESLEGADIHSVTRVFFEKLDLKGLSFDQEVRDFAHGYMDNGSAVKNGRLKFPAFAAGALGPAGSVAKFLNQLTEAYHHLDGVDGLSHDTAVEMLYGRDRGSIEFMGAGMGLGVFIGEAGDNKLAIHQGANEGFRALYIHCFAGPDCGKGFVIFANGDNKAVPFISEVAIELLKELKIEGIDESQLGGGFDWSSIEQEQIVNLGYKKLIFDAFQPCLPESIERPPVPHKLSKDNLVVGAKILRVTNQKFARAENLLSPYEPVFDPELFGRQGKVMDSWESARHNEDKYESLEMELSEESEIGFVWLSSKYHDGNQVEFVALDVLKDGNWQTLLPQTKMEGHSELKIQLDRPQLGRRIRIRAYPDGGLTRLGLYKKLPDVEKPEFVPREEAQPKRFAESIPQLSKPLTMDCRGKAIGSLVSVSNEHYGPAIQVLSPYPPLHMFDGFECARSRDPDHSEEIVFKLNKKRKVSSVLFDFNFFVNNSPKELGVCVKRSGRWCEIIARTNVKAYAGNQKAFDVDFEDEVDELRVRVFPDGGINRIYVL